MELEKLPGPVPSVVLSAAVVGLLVTLQQTPRAVTSEPPSEVTFPPVAAVVAVILVTDATVTEGITLLASFLQLIKSDKNSPADRIEKMAELEINFFIIN
jgi:hypothetical protein